MHEAILQRKMSEILYLALILKGSLCPCWHAYMVLYFFFFCQRKFPFGLIAINLFYFYLFFMVGRCSVDYNIIEASWLAPTSCFSYTQDRMSVALVLKIKQLVFTESGYPNFSPSLFPSFLYEWYSLDIKRMNEPLGRMTYAILLTRRLE